MGSLLSSRIQKNSSLPSCLSLLHLVLLILAMVTMDILSTSSMMALIVMTRRTNSVIRFQKNKNMKNVMLIMKLLYVTYIEECQYVTKTYCHEEQESRYHHSRIVGHDSRVVDEYHADHYGHDGYHKRSAD